MPTLLSQGDIDELLQAIRPGETPTVSVLEPILRRFKSAPRVPDLVTAFDDMCLPDKLIEDLQPLFDAYQLKIKVALVQDPYNLKKARSYTAAVGADFTLAVIHLKPWVMRNSDGIGFLMQATTNLRGHHLRILSQEVDAPAFGYDAQLKAVSERQSGQWSFVPWGLVQQALHGQIKLENALGFDPAGLQGRPATSEAWIRAANLKLEYADLKTIVQLIEKEMANNTEYLGGLIQAAWLPDALYSKAMSKLNGNFSQQALSVVAVISEWGAEPLAPSREHTCLGRFLICLSEAFGSEKKKTVDDIIAKYGLIKPT